MLEICCYGLDDALTAQTAGADRIELCSGQNDGGLTPSYGELLNAVEHITIPVHPIIRPRGGDFLYSKCELNTMKNDIALIRELGFAGVVLGVLDEQGEINRSQLKQLMDVTGDMSVTFHRAFDMSHNPYVSLDILTDMGIDRILTSGQQQTAEIGLPLICELNQRTQKPIILAGGGIRLTNVHKFVAAGLKEVHTSASQPIPSKMVYRRVGISMSHDEEADEFTRFGVDGDMVSALKGTLSAQCQMAG